MGRKASSQVWMILEYINDLEGQASLMDALLYQDIEPLVGEAKACALKDHDLSLA